MFIFIVGTFYPFTLQAQLKEKPISPVFNADGTVTLRLRAPEADSVSVRIQFLDKLKPMTKGDDGIWSTTLGPVEPNIYPYSFLVNGIPVIDPENPYIHSSLVPSWSLLFYHGDKPSFFDEQPVHVYDPVQQFAVVDVDVLERFRVDTIKLGRGFALDDIWWSDWVLPDGTPCRMPTTGRHSITALPTGQRIRRAALWMTSWRKDTVRSPTSSTRNRLKPSLSIRYTGDTVW